MEIIMVKRNKLNHHLIVKYLDKNGDLCTAHLHCIQHVPDCEVMEALEGIMDAIQESDSKSKMMS